MAITPPPGARATVTQLHPGANWIRNAQRSTTGAPLPNLFNACLALENDPEWAGKLRYNEMLQSVVLDDVPITDVKAYDVLHWMQANGIQRMHLEPVRQAIERIGRAASFHPIRDWLDSLEPDGTASLSSWLSDFLGVPDSEYHKQVSCLFLAAMVARIYEPGCKHDYTLVLEGPQRLEKSKFCEALAGGEKFFSDSLPSIEYDKEVSAHLAGKWLIEISELSAFQRADNEKLKAFLTRKYEKYRPAYGRAQVNEPRQCVFVATTNKKTWGKDETGARRFWPVRCNGTIKLDEFTAAREQLFAEAVKYYRNHHRWWPEGAIEDKHFVPEQDDRYEGDAWQQSIADWDRKIPIESINSYGNLTVTGRNPVNAPYYLNDIAYGALNLKADRFHVGDQRRLMAVLERLGWTRAKRTNKGMPWNPV